MAISSTIPKLLAHTTLTAAILTWASPFTLAQSITAAADGTGTQINQTGNTYAIGGGTQTGANLFHSFQDLGLSSGETANFLSNPSITNVLGRIVGGNPSAIDGLIRLTGGNSNLYLINPAGIIFHQGASLDISRSFVATTATRLGFEDGLFQVYGENDYAALASAPTSFIFDTETGVVVNEAALEVAAGESLWLVGSSVLNTGTLAAPGGNVTIAAIPADNQIRISQDQILMNLVLDAAPMGAENLPDQIGLSPMDIPRYLTGGSDLENANTFTVADNGSIYLSHNDNSRAFQTGDVGIAGNVTADSIQLMAAGQVTPTSDGAVQGNTTVVQFAEQGQGNTPLTLTAIDTTVDQYQDFLFGGTPGTISFTVNLDEDGIIKIGNQLAKLGVTETQADTVQIISEGSAGNFWLGNAFISDETIGQYEAQLQAWAPHLTSMADILIYACLVALGEGGDNLIHRLAMATGADVAASTNLTGSAALGGDWILENSTGAIEASAEFTPDVLAQYQGKLAIFTVTDGGDTGAGSLRQAISDANGVAGADEIRFSGVDLVDLTSGELAISDELTITGGNDTVTVARNASAGDFRIFNVTGGVTTTFDRLTITNGKTPDRGGGIQSNGAVNLTHSTITGNTSTDRGGGIYTPQAITITDSSISDNTTNQYGGGVATRRQIDVTNSTISGNYSRRNGAGLYSRSGNISVTDSTVSGNNSNRHGGGVWARGRNITLTRSTVSGNSSRVSAAGTYSQTLDVVDSVVSGNTSGDLGGGLYVTGTTNLTNTTVSNNSSTNKGGGIYFRNNLNITNSTISGNSSNRGGGIYSRGGGTVDIINSTISGNSSADRGGGIFARGNGGGTITLNNSTIANNIAERDGGGIFRNGGNINIANTIVANNQANRDGNDLSGTFNTIQNSLIGDTTDATIATDNNNLTNVDPQLLPLGDYGGDTQTHALHPHSPALNAGNNAVATAPALTTDQRGANRFNGTIDLGAFESQGYSLTPVTGDNQTALVNQNFSDTLTVQLTEDFANVALPIEAIEVTFTIQPGVTGASGRWLDSSTVTNASGIATAHLLANDTAGDFTVIVSGANLSDAIFNLANTVEPTEPVKPTESTEPMGDITPFLEDRSNIPVEIDADACPVSPILEIEEMEREEVELERHGNNDQNLSDCSET